MDLEVKNYLIVTLQYQECRHMVGFTNRFLDPQWTHEQTLLGFDQSVNNFEKLTVTLSL